MRQVDHFQIMRLQEEVDEVRAERDELRRHRDELVQLVAEALEALHENPSVTQIDLRDWIKSARKAIASTTTTNNPQPPSSEDHHA